MYVIKANNESMNATFQNQNSVQLVRCYQAENEVLRWKWREEILSTQAFNIQKSQTCVLFAEAGHNLRCSFQVSIHVFLPQPPYHHTHPLQGGGERELTHDTDLTGLRSRKHVAYMLVVEIKQQLPICYYFMW